MNNTVIPVIPANIGLSKYQSYSPGDKCNCFKTILGIPQPQNVQYTNNSVSAGNCVSAVKNYHVNDLRNVKAVNSSVETFEDSVPAPTSTDPGTIVAGVGGSIMSVLSSGCCCCICSAICPLLLLFILYKMM